MKHLRNQHARSILVVLALIVLIVIGSTLAFFTSRDEVTNRFTGSHFDILLTETKWNPQAAQNVLPGDTLPKNPQITNNDQTAGYVFLRITVPGDTLAPGTTDNHVPMFKFVVTTAVGDTSDATMTPAQSVNSNWTQVKDPVLRETSGQYFYEYVYAYTGGTSALLPLREGATTQPLFDKLQLWNFTENFTATQSHSVRVEALGIQANLMPSYSAGDIAAIWALLDGGAAG